MTSEDGSITGKHNDPIVLAHARALLASTPEGDMDHIAAQARAEATERLGLLMHDKQTLRSQGGEIARFFGAQETVEPGLVPVPEWRPDSHADAKSPSAPWGGVGRKC